MQQKHGFSIGSVILSYFMVAGGMFSGMLLTVLLKSSSQGVFYLMMGLGGFLGGFLAARASRGSTIVEPAIGAIAVVGTMIAVAAANDIGRAVLSFDHEGTMKTVGLVGGSAAVGALGGAFASEKMFGESSASSVPWILYLAFAIYGACIMAWILAMIALAGKGSSDAAKGGALFGGMAAGCFLSGIVGGAQARSRPLLASLLGGAIGVAGFFALIVKLADMVLSGFGGKGGVKADGDVVAGLIILAILGGIVSLLGALIGWFAIGKKSAMASAPAVAAARPGAPPAGF